MKTSCLLFVSLFAFSTIFAQRAGSLDGTFNGGKVTVDRAQFEGITRVAVLPDGKILASAMTMDEGQSFFGMQCSYFLLRFKPNGSLDAGFGDKGIVKTGFKTHLIPFLGQCSFAVQHDGKVVVVVAEEGNMYLVRYNTDGSIDHTFNKEVVSDDGVFQNPRVFIQSDGEIAVVASLMSDGGVMGLISAIDGPYTMGSPVYQESYIEAPYGGEEYDYYDGPTEMSSKTRIYDTTGVPFEEVESTDYLEVDPAPEEAMEPWDIEPVEAEESAKDTGAFIGGAPAVEYVDYYEVDSIELSEETMAQYNDDYNEHYDNDYGDDYGGMQMNPMGRWESGIADHYNKMRSSVVMVRYGSSGNIESRSKMEVGKLSDLGCPAARRQDRACNVRRRAGWTLWR
jgi:uncharacterized delta-60 repeat protein